MGLKYAVLDDGDVAVGALSDDCLLYTSGALSMNNLLRFQGLAVYSMIGITTGGILNMILDPIFIFGLDLGISGAALATAISQCIIFRSVSLETVSIFY